jgi:hypothetical protein
MSHSVNADGLMTVSFLLMTPPRQLGEGDGAGRTLPAEDQPDAGGIAGNEPRQDTLAGGVTSATNATNAVTNAVDRRTVLTPS